MTTRTEQRTRQVDVSIISCDRCGASAENRAQGAGFICCHDINQVSAAGSLLQALTGEPPEKVIADRHLCATCWAGLAEYFTTAASSTPATSAAAKEGVH